MDISQLLIQAKDPANIQVNNRKVSDVKKATKKQEKPKQTIRKSSGTLQSELNEDIFLKLLTSVYKTKQKSSMTYDKTMLSPTDLCGYCPRKVYFRMTNAEFELQLFYPYSELITHVGNAIHEWVQNVLASAYKNVESEFKFELPDKKLKGFIDLIYTTDDDKTIILEIKTIGDEIHDPQFYGKIPHWKQVAMYYHVWTQYLNKKCDKVQLLYLKRDFKPIKQNNGDKLLPFKIFTVDDPQKLWDAYGQDLMWMYNTVIDALRENKVPDIPPQRLELIKKEECGFCPYQKICSKHSFVSKQQIQSSIETLF